MSFDTWATTSRLPGIAIRQSTNRLSQTSPVKFEGIRRLRRAVLGCLIVATWLGGCGREKRTTEPQPPHAVILISIDTLRADYLGAYGYDAYPTSPFLDSFASDNILFENSFVVEPRTLTSHMSLMTGLYPQHHGVVDTTVLAGEIPTLASLLREQGYRTQAFTDGAWMDRDWGLDRGFDHYVVYNHQGFRKILPNAIQWLAKNGKEKFFLFLHTYDVHNRGSAPRYQSPSPYSGMFSNGSGSVLDTERGRGFRKRFGSIPKPLEGVDRDYVRATYAEGVRYVDDRLKELFEALRREGLYDRALIIVWSDHGEGLYDHADWSHGELFDHTVQVPLIMKIPGREGGGSRVRSVVSSIDLAPTILDLVGASIPASMEGTSLLPLLESERESNAGEVFSLRTKSGQRLFSIRNDRFRLIRDENADETLFFDLDVDPNEQNNLSPSGMQAEVELGKRLARWIEEHDQARSLAKHGTEVHVDSKTTDELRALGYVE